MFLYRLRVADGASLDAHAQEHNRYCLPNTRVELLEQIEGWAKEKSAEPIFLVKWNGRNREVDNLMHRGQVTCR